MGQMQADNLPGVTVPIEVASLPKSRPHHFAVSVVDAQIEALKEALDLLSLKKLKFEGTLAYNDHGELCLSADLGATVTQACVVTLEPVRTRIDAHVVRRFSADYLPPEDDRQMLEEEDENLEPLQDSIDLGLILMEAIALNLPDFPRAEGAELTQRMFSEPGVDPLQDEDVKPFAGLSALKDKLADGEKGS